MKILVTGLAGFISSHFCENLLSLGHTVIGLDDFSTGRLSNLETLRESERFTLIEHDVRDEIGVWRCCRFR